MVIVTLKRSVKILELLCSALSLSKMSHTRPELGILEIEFVCFFWILLQESIAKYSVLLGGTHDLKFWKPELLKVKVNTFYFLSALQSNIYPVKWNVKEYCERRKAAHHQGS